MIVPVIFALVSMAELSGVCTTEELLMSVTGHVIFVDWEELQRQCRDDGHAVWTEEFYEEWEQQGGWPTRFEAESWRPPDWNESWNAAFQAASEYDRLRKGLDAKTRNVLDRILGAFFWEGGSALPDIPGFQPSEGICNVLSPQTIDEMAGLADSLDLEALREPFARRCRPAGGWICSFEDFRDYLRQWLDVLHRARGSGRAAILWVA